MSYRETTAEGLAFPAAEYSRRMILARAALAERGLAAAICVSPETMHYLAGYDGYSFFSEQALVITSDDDDQPVLLVREVDEPMVRETSWLSDVRTYHYGADDPAQIVSAILAEKGVPNGPVGLEMQSYAVPAVYGNRLHAALGKRELVDVTRDMGVLRIQKSDAELEYVRRAARLTNIGLESALEVIRPGVTEHEVGAAVEYALRRNGSEYASVPFSIGSGPRTAGGHSTPTDRVLQSGEPVAFYFAGVVRRYHVSTYHTVHLGEPSGRFLELYEAAETTLTALSDAVKVGRPVSEAAFVAHDTLAGYGLAQHAKMRWGYGIGIGYPPVWIEPLEIIEESREVFAPGMVMCLHICLFLPEEELGLIVGGDFLLSEDGLEALDAFGPSLRIL